MMEQLRSILNLLKDKVKKTQTITKGEINALLNYFPFNKTVEAENLNFYLLKLIFKRSQLVDRKKLSQKLEIDDKNLNILLEQEPVEVCFPIISESHSRLVKALVVPLKDMNKIIFPDRVLFKLPDIEEGLETILKLFNKGFLISFDYTNFSGKSFTLAIYTALKYGKKAEKFAYTGVVLENGSIEPIDRLEEKLKSAQEYGKPLIFPSKDLTNFIKLDKFLKELEIPISMLFNKKDVKKFEDTFPFKGDYIKKVFHLKDIALHYTTESGVLKETPKEFQKAKIWVENVLNKLLEKVILYLKPFGTPKIALTQKIVVLSFISGIEFSKKRISVKFYNYDNTLQSYKESYTIFDDREVHPEDILYEYFEIEEPQEDQIKRIYISFKNKPQTDKAALIFYKKADKAITAEELHKKLGNALALYLRKYKEKFYEQPPELILQAPNPFAFAFGYYLEDYLPLKVVHKDIIVYITRPTISSDSKVLVTETVEDLMDLLSSYYGKIIYTFLSRKDLLKILKDRKVETITNNINIHRTFTKIGINIELVSKYTNINVKNIVVLKREKVIWFKLEE